MLDRMEYLAWQVLRLHSDINTVDSL
jgi:hypothetical protein